MTLQSDHFDNSEIYCTVEDFAILTELQSPFAYKI